jgi:hypothetical protein
MDLAASNWGRNTPYEGWRRDGLRVYYGDMDGNGTWEVVECHWDEALKKEVPNLPLEYLAGGLPALGQRFSSHLAYGRSSAREILKDMADPARMLRVDWLESTVFLNRGGTFEARPLPTEAQMAPAFGVTVADVDGDGHEDLAMTQNLFGVFPLTPRYDAGRGLVMVGDGRGNFRALSGDESGVVMYGEQRGCAAADYDGDGRVDLLIGQNGRETKLYRNVRGRPGIRVRLEGPPDNRHAAGAMVRLVYGADFGPAREWHLGHGYWSQNGAVQVLGGEAEPTAVWVRFPGEEGKTWAWLQGARDVVISHAQGVRLAPKN